MPDKLKNRYKRHPNGVSATISDDRDVDSNGAEYGGRYSSLGRNPAFMAGNHHSGGHMSFGVYNDASPPTDEKGSNIDGAADPRIWKGFGKPVPAKTWK